jgi:DnaJ homolog subfamily A member 2
MDIRHRHCCAFSVLYLAWVRSTFVSQTLQSLLPPKRVDPDPEPPIVDTAQYEETDMGDVRERAFPASSDFFDDALHAQFGHDDDDDDDDAWVDDEEGDDEDVECRPQ